MEEIYGVGGALTCAVTLPEDAAPRKSGRVYPEAFCAERSIPLLHMDNINRPEAVEFLSAHDLDWLFIIGWSQIARSAVLDAPRSGVIGAHPTLLPIGRGRAAIPWTILKDLKETGVTLFKMDAGVDSGPIIAQRRIKVDPCEDAGTLYDKIRDAHRVAIRGVWRKLVVGNVTLTEQDDSRATVWPGRRPEDGEIRRGMAVAEVERLVRAVTHPYPGAFLVERDRVVRVWRGAVGDARTDPPAGAYRIRCVDGVYDAYVFEFEDGVRGNAKG